MPLDPREETLLPALELALPRALWLAWHGPYPLVGRHVRQIDRHSAGVYMVHDYWPEELLLPVAYVGQSADLRSRLLEHAGVHCGGNLWVGRALEVRRMWFTYALVPYGAVRAGVEASLIRIYCPPYNAQVPQARCVLVNLPTHSGGLPTRRRLDRDD